MMPMPMTSESSRPKISLLVTGKSKPLGSSSSYAMSSSSKKSTKSQQLEVIAFYLQD